MQVDSFKALVANLESQLQEAGRALAAARRDAAALEAQHAQHAGLLAAASHLQLQLASREAAIAALQAQLAAATGSSGGSSSSSSGGGTSGAEDGGPGNASLSARASSAAQQPGAPSPHLSKDSVTLSPIKPEGIVSLERVVGMWKKACAAKDRQMARLQEEVDQVRWEAWGKDAMRWAATSWKPRRFFRPLLPHG
jgi:hypothetical protein